jgi:hypothetical protein
MRRALYLAALALVAWLVGAVPAQAAFPGYNGKLVTVHGATAAHCCPLAIYTVFPDGRGASNLVSNLDPWQPAWSADGTRLVFNHDGTDEDPTRTYVMNADGTGMTQVGEDFMDPAWTPDGRIVFTGGGSAGISVANADGSGITSIPNTTFGGEPQWSPDGSKIAFSRQATTGEYDVYTIRPDGTELTNLTGDIAEHASSPNWSPDGTRIAFQRSSRIWTMRADGTDRVQITTNINTSSPVWSPDGTRIAYHRSFDDSIYTSSSTAPTSPQHVYAGRYLDWQPCQAPCPSPPPPAYDVPKMAQTLWVPLVPNFRQTISGSQCRARGGQESSHGPPLAFASCDPPGFLPGTVAHFGRNDIYIHSDVWLEVRPGTPASGDQADVLIYAQVFDIRTASGAFYDPDPAGPDVTLSLKLRVTDGRNGSSEDQAGTVRDFELEMPVTCGPLGSNPAPACFGNSTADALMPGLIQEGGDMVIQVFNARVKDSGLNGVRGDTDDRIFGAQGITVQRRGQ